MAPDATGIVPGWLRWAALALLAWNIIGIGFFLSQYAMTPGEIAKLPETQRYLWSHMTLRVWIAYALAVCAGTGGAAALLLRRRSAVLLSAVSLIALVVQFTNPTLLEVAAREGPGIMAFPIFLIAVGAVQLSLAWSARTKGWLS